MKQIINDINKKIKCEYQFDNIIDKVNTNNVIIKISKKNHYKFSLMISRSAPVISFSFSASGDLKSAII